MLEPREQTTGDLVATVPALLSPDRIVCPGCGRANPAARDRRYCSRCGRSLWERCLKCKAEGPVGEPFCGSCGARHEDLVGQRSAALQLLLDQARQLLTEQRYEEARRRLRSVADASDPTHQALADQARQELAALDTAEQQARQAAERRRADAESLLQARDYQQALFALHLIPPALRDERVQELLKTLRAHCDEVQGLEHELETTTRGKQLLQQRPVIERLLELRPDHALARQRSVFLRDRLLTAARQRLAAHQYQHAVRLLEQIPSVARDKEVQLCMTQAGELDWLWRHVQAAALADDTTLELIERLRESAPGNPAVNQLEKKLHERAARPADDATLAAPNWSPPDSTVLGVPVNWIAGVRRFTCGQGAVKMLRAHPGRFFVALGLALQALGRATVNINLAPDTKSRGLGGVKRWFQKPPQAAWGLDLGESAVKAVRLSGPDAQGRLQIEAAEVVEHDPALTRGTSELERRAVLLRSLGWLRERVDLAGTRAAASLPRAAVLSRWFQLPPMAAKLVEEAVRLEARMQVPYSLEDLQWGYHLGPRPEASGEPAPWGVTLQAARPYQVESLLELYQEAGWTLDIVSGEGLALHNFALHDRVDPPAAEGRPTEAVAVLDVGGTATQLVISSIESLWVRTLRFESDMLTSALVDRFRLAWDQAEALKRKPLAARRLSGMYEAVEPLLLRLRDEIQRAFEEYRRTCPQTSIRELIGVGRGFGFHGLLQTLRAGS